MAALVLLCGVISQLGLASADDTSDEDASQIYLYEYSRGPGTAYITLYGKPGRRFSGTFSFASGE